MQGIQRAKVMAEMYREGFTMQQIGEKFNVSRQRVRQILANTFPDTLNGDCGVFKRTLNKLKFSDDALREKAQKKWGTLPRKYRSDLEHSQFEFYRRKKQNAKKTKHEWSITMQDLSWPTHCPVLGIELDWNLDKRQENSPSMDRIDNTKGYIPGNVEIISYRANRIKNDGTWEEHESIAKWLKRKAVIIDM